MVRWSNPSTGLRTRVTGGWHVSRGEGSESDDEIAVGRCGTGLGPVVRVVRAELRGVDRLLLRCDAAAARVVRTRRRVRYRPGRYSGGPPCPAGRTGNRHRHLA